MIDEIKKNIAELAPQLFDCSLTEANVSSNSNYTNSYENLLKKIKEKLGKERKTNIYVKR